MVSNDKSVKVSAGSAENPRQNVKFSYNEDLLLKLYYADRSEIRNRCQYDLYVDERKLLKNYPDGKLWVAGLKKDELATLGLITEQTCNCNGKWYYLVDEVMARRVLKITKYLKTENKRKEYQATRDRLQAQINEIDAWFTKHSDFAIGSPEKRKKRRQLEENIKITNDDIDALGKQQLRTTGWLLTFEWVLHERTPEQVLQYDIDSIITDFNIVISDPHKIERIEVVAFKEDCSKNTIVKFQIKEGYTLRDDIIVEFYDFEFSEVEANKRVKMLRERENTWADMFPHRYADSEEVFYKIYIRYPAKKGQRHTNKMTYSQALEKWYHKWTGNGYLCPVTKRIVDQCYTNHELGGVMDDDGKFVFKRVVPNSCRFCGDSDFTVAGRLHELNDQKKQESEQAKNEGTRITYPTDDCNNSTQIIFESWAHGARVRLHKFGSLYYSSTKFLLGDHANIYFMTSDWDEALKFHMDYSKALLWGMDNPEYLLPYPWMSSDEDIEDDDDDLGFLVCTRCGE